MKKGILILLSISVCLSAACWSILAISWGIPQDWLIKQDFRVIDDASYIFEEYAYTTTESADKHVYYWSALPLEEVATYYENLTENPSPTEHNDEGWRITLFRKNRAIVEQLEWLNTYHFHFCDTYEYYSCVTVALVEANRPDRYRFPIYHPEDSRRYEMPPELTSLPDYGTLIIYSNATRQW